MNEKNLDTLEFGKILQRLAGFTSFSVSRELATTLRPLSHFPEVINRQKEVTQARRLLDLKPNISARGANDVRSAVHEASMDRTLETTVLLDIRATLEVCRVATETVVRLQDQFPQLAEIMRPVTDFRSIEREISRCINERGEVTDHASPALKLIRSDLRISHDRLQSRLAEILNSSTNKMAIQDSIITLRGGRYVIPVKADFKGQLKGIVHDTSASGATYFVEPLETVELNNTWRELQIEEKREIDKVLRKLSRLVGRWRNAIQVNIEALAYFDLVIAKARYAQATRAVEPIIRPLRTGDSAGRNVGIILKEARHPLLGGNVVPIDVEVGETYLALIITGPNTGGKTVALKTIGLLAAMALAGLHITAEHGSQIPVFESIFADIGDEQSIEQSLSTFSSHISNIRDILVKADSSSLVLLDELGAGTDPAEGSVLAKAILYYLLARKILTVATTHYNELKVFAYNTAEVENASVEFDIDTLSPKYKLAIGLPGRSNALAIANRLGLPEEIISSAKLMLDPTEAEVEALLFQIQRERDEAVARAQAAERERAEAEKIKKSLGDRLASIEDEKEQMLSSAMEELLSDTASVRDKLRRAASALERSEVKPAEFLALQMELSGDQKNLQRKIRERVRPTELRQVEPLRIGDTVLLKNLGQSGELLSLPDEKGDVEIQLGAFKVKVRADRVARTAKRKDRYLNRVNVLLANEPESRAEKMHFQLDLRGKRSEEALHEIDKYLNDAYLAGLPSVRLIHGKGTGVLRQAVRQQLAHHPLVKSFEAAEIENGGEGVTVATLAL